MYRTILVISIVIIFGLGAYLIYPVIKGKFQPMLSLAELDAIYTGWLSENGLTDPVEDINIVITKDNRGLYLMSGDDLIQRWDVALSLNPVGGKTLLRDGKTPVGTYHITRRDRRTDHHLMLYINYPNIDDASAALNDELISELEHREIMTQSNKGLDPPDDTPLGGGLGIHGGGTSRDWTDGSFAVDDSAIEILWSACPDDTSVIIYENFTDWELSGFISS